MENDEVMVARHKQLAVWGLIATAALSLQLIPGRLEGHVLCGEWGCVPPLQTLVAQNGFWVAIWVPLIVWAVRSWPPENLRSAALALAIAAGLYWIISVSSAYTKWAAVDLAARQSYWPQRILLNTATSTLLPLPHAAAAGLACWWIARRRLKMQAELGKRPGFWRKKSNKGRLGG